MKSTGSLHRVIAIVALLWNLAGAAALGRQATLSDAAIAALPPTERAIQMATPAWLTGVFALAVATGVAGAIGLLLRRRWAVPCLQVSLFAVVAQVVLSYALTPAWALMGPAHLGFPLWLVAAAAAQWAYARQVARRGGLG